MASNDLNLRSIRFQGPLRSKPVRQNFSEIESEFNALRAEVQASLAATASETTAARDNQDSLSDNIHLRARYGNTIFATTDFVSSISGLTFSLGAGNGIVNGVGVDIASTVSATASLPASGKKRIDALVIDTSNSVTIQSGTAVSTASAATFPAIAQTQEVLYDWTIFDTTGTLAPVSRRYKGWDPFDQLEYADYKYSFQGDTVSTLEAIKTNGESVFFKYNFTGATISTIGTTIEGKRYVETYIFTGDTISTTTFREA